MENTRGEERNDAGKESPIVDWITRHLKPGSNTGSAYHDDAADVRKLWTGTDCTVNTIGLSETYARIHVNKNTRF